MGCLTRILRSLMFIINVTVFITGACLLGVGIWMCIDASSFEYLFTKDTLTVVSIVTICSGSLMFLIGFCGCCGTLKGSTCLLKTYFVVLLLLTITMFACGITALVYFDEVEDYMEERIYTIITNEYNITTAATETIDGLQNDFDCCGSKGPEDWGNSTFWENGKELPESCCVDGEDCTESEYPFKDPSVHQQGCYDSFTQWINDHVGVIAGVSLGFITVVILAMVFACCMIKNKDEYEYA